LAPEKLESQAIVQRCLPDNSFSRFHRTPAFEGGVLYTDTHRAMTYTAPAQRRAEKITPSNTPVIFWNVTQVFFFKFQVLLNGMQRFVWEQ